MYAISVPCSEGSIIFTKSLSSFINSAISNILYFGHYKMILIVYSTFAKGITFLIIKLGGSKILNKSKFIIKYFHDMI